jgi:hypothetical protein
MNKSIRPRDNQGRFVKTSKEVVPLVLEKTKPPTKPPIKSSTKPPTTNLSTCNKRDTRKRIVAGSSKQTQTKEIVEQPEDPEEKPKGWNK